MKKIIKLFLLSVVVLAFVSSCGEKMTPDPIKRNIQVKTLTINQKTVNAETGKVDVVLKCSITGDVDFVDMVGFVLYPSEDADQINYQTKDVNTYEVTASMDVDVEFTYRAYAISKVGTIFYGEKLSGTSKIE